MSNLIPAIMRTGVPIIYAILIKLGVSRLGLPDAVVTDVATVLLSVLLYAALRGLEALEPKLGVLLGWVGQPQYASKVGAQVTDWENAVISAIQPAIEKVKADVLAEVEGVVDSKLKATTKKAPAKKTAAKSTKA